MTPGEYSDQLRAKLEDLKKNNRPFKLAVYSMVAKSYSRIFGKGLSVNGRFVYKSKWYKQYREKKNRQTAYVDWFLSGDLRSEYANNVFASDSTPSDIKVDLRNPPELAKEINPNLYETVFSRGENIEKYKHLQKLYGDDFLNVSEREQKNAFKILEKELKEIFEA